MCIKFLMAYYSDVKKRRKIVPQGAGKLIYSTYFLIKVSSKFLNHISQKMPWISFLKNGWIPVSRAMPKISCPENFSIPVSREVLDLSGVSITNNRVLMIRIWHHYSICGDKGQKVVSVGFLYWHTAMYFLCELGRLHKYRINAYYLMLRVMLLICSMLWSYSFAYT